MYNMYFKYIYLRYVLIRQVLPTSLPVFSVRLFSREDKKKSHFARKKSPSGKRAL